jgi:putative transposase
MNDEVLETHVVTTELTEEGRLKLEIIQSLAEPCDRKTYSRKLKEATERLSCSTRTVQRLVKKWETDGLTAFITSNRSDKGQY